MANLIHWVNVSRHFSHGGASTASMRIHLALAKNQETHSEFLYTDRIAGAEQPPGTAFLSSDSYISKNRLLNRLLMNMRHFVGEPWRDYFDFLVFRNPGLEQALNRSSIDAVVFHAIRAREMPLRSLRKIEKNIFIVLHDARWILGISHYPAMQSSRDQALANHDFVGRSCATFLRRTLENLGISLIAPSGWLKKLAAEVGWRDQSICEIGLPVDIEFWSPSQIERRFGARQNFKIGFGFFGEKAAFRKGEDLLHSAVRRLAAGGDKGLIDRTFEFHFFGDASPVEISSQDTVSQVIHGRLGPESTRDLFRSLDLVVVPSRQENLAQISLEAQACATPVIVMDNTGLTSTIPNNTKLLIPNPTGQAVYNAIKAITEDSMNLSRLGAEGRAFLANKFEQGVIAKKFLEFYNDIRRLG